MSSTNTLALQSFLAALAELSEPLPAPVLQAVRQISQGWNELLQEGTTVLADRLDAIAASHSPLLVQYQPAYDFFLGYYQVGERTKTIGSADFAIQLPDSEVAASSTLSVAVGDAVDDGVNKGMGEGIAEVALLILTAPDPVEAAIVTREDTEAASQLPFEGDDGERSPYYWVLQLSQLKR